MQLNSVFIPLFTLVSLIIIYPYFKNNNIRYYKYIAIIGFLYDVTYCNTILFNTFIFPMIGFVIALSFYLLANNIIINVIVAIITITLYRTVTFIFYYLFYNINSEKYLSSIYNSLILNIIYCVILYLISSNYSKKRKIHIS